MNEGGHLELTEHVIRPRTGSTDSPHTVMLGRDERANRLRQSPPYVGLLPREAVRKLNEEAAG